MTGPADQCCTAAYGINPRPASIRDIVVVAFTRMLLAIAPDCFRAFDLARAATGPAISA